MREVLFNEHGAVPVLRFALVLEGVQRQTQPVNGLENIDSNAVEGGARHALIPAGRVVHGGAFRAQTAVGKGHGEILSVKESAALHLVRGFL